MVPEIELELEPNWKHDVFETAKTKGLVLRTGDIICLLIHIIKRT